MRYQSDYILRLIEQMGQLLRDALERFQQGETGESLELAEQVVASALDVEPELVGRLSPASFASLLDLQNPDDRVIDLVARALDLEAEIREREGELIEAGVHREQARAVRELLDARRAN